MVRLTQEMKGMPIEGGLQVDLAADVFMGHEFTAEVLEAGPVSPKVSNSFCPATR
jgi:threonine dehydrogenase-like Zn-dependent dehydrogenase